METKQILPTFAPRKLTSTGSTDLQKDRMW